MTRGALDEGAMQGDTGNDDAGRRPVLVMVDGSAPHLDVEPRTSLAAALREAGATAVHVGCEQGVCGTCTVLLDGSPVRSCLVLAVQAEGATVETAGSLAEEGRLGSVQRCFAARGALQCGFCTPGFLVLTEWLARQPGEWDEEEVRDVVTANLCRCTGYAPIVAAVTDVCRQRRPQEQDKSR